MRMETFTKFNEWWETHKVNPELLKDHKRPLFFELQKYMEDRQILLITGLRRVGKTTLLYQLIQDLLNKKVEAEKIMYFSFDERKVEFDELIDMYEEKILKEKIKNEKIYIFLDEIQKLEDWQNKIKIFYDLHPNVKFIISGSASVQISKKAKESLAGRIFDFLLEPLSFGEFLKWKNVKINKEKIKLFQREARSLFYDYLRKGGFPEIVDEQNSNKIKNYIKNNVIERIIYKDLPEEFGIKDYELLKTIVEMIARQPGMIINYNALSRDLHKNKQTIMDYFFYLQYALLVRVVANYRKGFLVSSRKKKKAYMTNTAVPFALVENFSSDEFLQKIAENFAVIETKTKNYYRNEYEIDIILKKGDNIIPIEVKYGRPEVKSIRKFLSEFKFNKGLILTKEKFDQKKEEQGTIFFVPLWAFSLQKEKYLNRFFGKN